LFTSDLISLSTFYFLIATIRAITDLASRAFLQDYNHHKDSKVFDATKLDLRKVGKSFGFDTPPRVEVKTVEEKVADKFSRPYGPAKPKLGVKRKAQ
jgi:hypothetical protein